MSTKKKTKTKKASPAGIPAQWTWHHRVLQQLRERLADERAGQAAEAAEPLEPHSMDIADSATDEFDHDLALGLLSREQDALYEVDAALRRIADGTYGVCEETGKPIPSARLRAVPWTRYTKEVGERLEHEGAMSRPHLGRVASVQKGGPPAGLAQIEEPEDEGVEGREDARRRRAGALKARGAGTSDKDAQL
jgi:RNA polymerase-binding protein DksA